MTLVTSAINIRNKIEMNAEEQRRQMRRRRILANSESRMKHILGEVSKETYLESKKDPKNPPDETGESGGSVYPNSTISGSNASGSTASGTTASGSTISGSTVSGSTASGSTASGRQSSEVTESEASIASNDDRSTAAAPMDSPDIFIDDSDRKLTNYMWFFVGFLVRMLMQIPSVNSNVFHNNANVGFVIALCLLCLIRPFSIINEGSPWFLNSSSIPVNPVIKIISLFIFSPQTSRKCINIIRTISSVFYYYSLYFFSFMFAHLICENLL